MEKDLVLEAIKQFISNPTEVYDLIQASERAKFIKDLDTCSRKLKARHLNNSASSLVFKFGRYKDSSILDVPAWYLLWCYEQDWFKQNNKDLYTYIKSNLKMLKKQKEQDDNEIAVRTIIGED